MSANLVNSNALANAPWFNGLVRAGMVEYALQHPNDRLSRSMVRDPAYMLPMFVSVVADNPAISADGWATADSATQQNDVRFALAVTWAMLAGAIPNLEPQSARIPVLESDAPASSNVSIWVQAGTGALCVRDEAEVIHIYPAGG